MMGAKKHMIPNAAISNCTPSFIFIVPRELNAYGNPAAAKNRLFQNPPDPPLGFTALFVLAYLETSASFLRNSSPRKSTAATMPSGPIT